MYVRLQQTHCDWKLPEESGEEKESGLDSHNVGSAPLTLSALAHVQCRPEGCAAAEHSATMRAAPATGSAPQWLGSGV